VLAKDGVNLLVGSLGTSGSDPALSSSCHSHCLYLQRDSFACSDIDKARSVAIHVLAFAMHGSDCDWHAERMAAVGTFPLLHAVTVIDPPVQTLPQSVPTASADHDEHGFARTCLKQRMPFSNVFQTNSTNSSFDAVCP